MIRRILSIDGGGIRGILPGRFLAAIEARAGRPTGDLFDLIAGTSTGGILGAAVAQRVPAKDLVDLYVNRGGAIFSRDLGDEIATFDGVFGPKYSAATLETELKAVLGNAWLSEAQTKLLVPAYCIQLPRPRDLDSDGIDEAAASWIFKSWGADDAHDFPLWQVARATSAAPTYFPPAAITSMHGERYVMIDGGVFANDPSMCAIAEAGRLWADRADRIICLSLGTGSKVTALDGTAAQSWGIAQWLPELTSIFLDGAADAVSYQAHTCLGGDFIRSEIALAPPVNDAFDDASAENIAALMALADAQIERDLDRVMELFA
jgi:patatin-like phospholipase/acyl hydrolase